ncbi:CDP-diacylglycerol--glycerol-3-phosphate 3-phosphatidyltransferase [bacterium]|nr:CDP-diacylglycerol--glycerol-3-phosphate 3-phosphatidyltransferase [bacterium]|tara:strand:- start:405 stop:1721 length:1317 start_codon:yes stop_codon:yes gene_type:complete
MVIKSLANLITVSRILGVAYLFWLMPFSTERTQLICIILFTIVASTDALDGWVARRYKIVSEFGKLLDPLADKILLLILLPLVSMGVIKPFPVFLIFAREFAIMGVRVLAAKRKFSVEAKLSGKIKTALTLPICGILFARPTVIELSNYSIIIAPFIWLKRWVSHWPPIIFEGLIWIMVGATLISFIDYVIKFMWQRQLLLHRNNTEKATKALLAYIPNTISLLNMGCGIFSIIMVFNNQLYLAGALIIAGMILDGLDGRLARRLDVYSKFGEKIDSKADYVTFGIAPATLLMGYCRLELALSYYIAIGLGVLYFFGVYFRLKRFNSEGHQENFTGLPSPIGALFVATSTFSWLSHPWLFIATNILNIGVMVSRLKYPHNQSAHKKRFFQQLKIPVLIAIFLVFLRYMGVTFLGSTVNNTLLLLMAIYYLAPFMKDSQ